MTNVQKNMENTLTEKLRPQVLEVLNESHRHNVPPDSESHFKITVVSETFDGISLLERHRLINALLAEHLAGSVHAIALHAHTPDEWETRGKTARASPPCLGGDRADRD